MKRPCDTCGQPLPRGNKSGRCLWCIWNARRERKELDEVLLVLERIFGAVGRAVSIRDTVLDALRKNDSAFLMDYWWRIPGHRQPLCRDSDGIEMAKAGLVVIVREKRMKLPPPTIGRGGVWA